MEEEKREKVGRGRRRSPISQDEDDDDDDDDDDDGDIFSHSILGDIVVESQDTVKEYATIALNHWISYEEASFDLVGWGPMASGPGSAGRFLHLNFQARSNDDPAASVETYFTELIQTHTHVIKLLDIRCLGPSSSLPAKANTFGCLYCSSRDIHHPDDVILKAFHNGREYHWKALESQYLKLRDFISRSKGVGSIPTLSHPGFKYFPKGVKQKRFPYATMALSLFNCVNKGTNFKLVKPGPYVNWLSRLEWIVHTNFEAKNQDDPDAPIQTFFAELISGRDYVFAVVCKCLGPSDSLEPEEANLEGCYYCGSPSIHHPPGPGYLTGREYLADIK